MAKGRRPLSAQELTDHFSTDEAGDLYWKDEKVKAGGWTTANRLAFVALLVAIVSAGLSILVNYAAIAHNADVVWTYVHGLFP